MYRINGQTAQTVTTKKRDYALRRMGIALERVVAAPNAKQREKEVAWSLLWLRHWKRLLAEIAQARKDFNEQLTQTRCD